MAVSVLQRRWGSAKPPVGSQIDTGHSLAQGLAGAWLLDRAALDLTGRSPGLGSPSNAIFQQQGAVASTAAGYIPLRTSKLVGGEVNLTMMSWGTVTGVQGGGRAAYCERGSTGNDILKIGLQSASGNAMEVTYRNDGATLTQLRASKTINDGLPHQIVGRKLGTALTAWVDGNLDASATFGSASDAFTDATVEARACGDKGDTSAGWVSGVVFQIYVWRRALLDEEIRWLHEDPYAFIVPPAPYRRYIDVPAVAPPPSSASKFFAVF